MALVVETGACDPAAESYCSVDAADSYHAKLGNTAWAALTIEAKEIALRKATNFMLQRYREKWDGYRRTVAQALDWPRTEVRRRDAPTTYGSVRGFMLTYYSIYEVPAIVIQACAELALRSVTQELLPDLTRKVQSESVAGLSVVYAQDSSQLVKFTAIDALLNPVLRFSGSAATIRRA